LMRDLLNVVRASLLFFPFMLVLVLLLLLALLAGPLVFDPLMDRLGGRV
jgi:hypothetical protein